MSFPESRRPEGRGWAGQVAGLLIVVAVFYWFIQARRAPLEILERRGLFASRDSALIVALETRVEQATLRGDVAFLDSVYAPSFRYTLSTGERGQRADALRNRSTHTLRRDLDSLDVEVHDDVALTTGRIHVRQESAEPKWRDYTIRYARVYVRRGGVAGRWQLLHSSER